MEADYQELETLLEQRLAVIANHELRDRDPDEQLKQLQEVSGSIVEIHQKLVDQLPPRLAHFLENCSYDKALDWLKNR